MFPSPLPASSGTPGVGESLALFPCHHNELWCYLNGTLQNAQTGSHPFRKLLKQLLRSEVYFEDASFLIHIHIQQGVQEGVQKGIQQGIRLGMVENSREAVIDILRAHFENIPRSLVAAINELDDLSFLKELLKKAVKIGSLGEFQEILHEEGMK